MNRTLITALIIIVVAGVGGYLLLRDGTNGDYGTATDSTSDAATTTNENAGGRLMAKNSVLISGAMPGSSVIIPGVMAEAPSFIAIHRDENGKPGKVIGHSILLETGLSQNVSVTLSESVKVGDKLYAMLHKDADNDGKYTFPGADVPVMTEDGMIVMTAFEISTSTTPIDVNAI